MSYKQVTICSDCRKKEGIGIGFPDYKEFEDGYFDAGLCDFCEEITVVCTIGIIEDA